MANDIDAIRAARDEALDALGDTRDAIESKIQQLLPNASTSLVQRLTKRDLDIGSERDQIRMLAQDEVLALPSIQAAGNRLKGIGDRLTQRAAELPSASNFLKKSSQILDLATQFADIFAQSQKKQ